MKPLKTVIIDDEADAVNLLKLQLVKYCQLSDITTYTNSSLALEALRKSPPDLLFLDIEMPLINGFELLQELMPIGFQVIFTTAYNQYAIKAFKFNAVDYLIKPIDTDDLMAAVLRVQNKRALNAKTLKTVQKQIKGTTIDKMAISTHEGVSFIDLNEIIYAEADSNYSTLVLINDRRFVISKTLKDLQELLEESHFLRIHRQYIINLNHLKHLDRTKSLLTMANKHELSIARDQKDKLMEMYKWL
ncbi:LytR/AlgR family response regulator transcription factor [Mucilaginibacter celer]|uniref:Response regulator n=1 Tax=Mucilaginibacter celer TaxID=2305508 RepID=A0A494VWY4_9SPHI|nr:LytTR family DNA-binding domain-containing protein [Mucilaginibacter celer]AYL95828.1 response regulator [Mucilaginibacter celer]